MRGLRGKVAIVAGAAPGNIGAATAVRLAEDGAIVVAADRSESATKSLADEIRASGGQAVGRSFDVTDERSYRELIDFTLSEYGALDGLFNAAADLSAATVARDTDAMSVPLAVWRRRIEMTLTGYSYGIRHALPIMLERGRGSIVNCMSSIVWMGEDGRVLHQSAESALYGLTRQTATVGGKGVVRCNSLAAGVILTGAAGRALNDEHLAQILASIRSPRLGVPEDIASVVAFLLSDDAPYINGQTIVVHGGATSLRRSGLRHESPTHAATP